MLTTAFGKDKFNCGITGSRKTEKMSMTILILAEQARQQPMENIEGVKEMILNNSRITIKEFADDDGTQFSSCQANLTNVLGTKRVQNEHRR